MPARWRGGLGAVLHAGTSLAKWDGGLVEVLWRDRAPERAEPLSFLLFQDAQLAGSGVVATAPSQEGAYLGTAYAQAGNEGDLLPYVSGPWDTTAGTAQPVPVDLELQVVRTGSLYQSSEWGWKYSSDPAQEWRGMDDMRWMRMPHCPFGDTASRGSCLTLCHSTLHNRIIATYHPTATTEAHICIRSAATASGEDWGPVQVLNFAASKAPSGGGYAAMWELADGALRWAFTKTPDSATAPSDRDIDIYGSTDGGDTWVLVKANVVTELLGAPAQIQKFQIVVSGSWMRLEAYNLSSTPQGIFSAVSADRCATWQLVGDGTPDGLDDTMGNNDASNRFETWDVCAVDDSGTFMRVRGVNTGASDRLNYELAVRDGAWERIGTTEGATFQPLASVNGYAVFLARGGGRIWLLFFESDRHSTPAGADFWAIGSYIIPEPLVNGGWTAITPRIERWSQYGRDDWMGYNGVVRVFPKNGQLRWLGDRLGFIHTGADRETGTTTTDQQTPSVRYIGGPSRRPLRLDQPTNVDFTSGELFDLFWESGLGGLGTAPMTSSFSPWTESVGTGTKTWTPAFMQIAMASTNSYWSSNTLFSSLTQQRICDDGVFVWSTRAAPASPGDTDWPPNSVNYGSPYWGAVVKSASLRTAGLTLSVAVHISGETGRFSLYDVAAGTTLWASDANALAGITAGTWYDFRLGCAHSSALDRTGSPVLFVELAAARAGDFEWVSSGLLTVSGGAASYVSEQVQFGHFRARTASVGLTVQWREAGYSRQSRLNQVDFTSPGSLRGWSCLPHTIRVGQGHDVLWGGAGGFQGDLYDCPVRHEYGVEQVLLDTPASQWRSTSGSTQQIVLDATLLKNDPNARFVHSGFAAVSTNSRLFEVEYSDSASFSDAVLLTVDGKRYEATISATAAPVHIQLEGDWQDGELAGSYIRATTGSQPIAKVVGNAGSWLHLTGITTSLAGYGLSAGSTVALWGTQHLQAYEDHPDGVRVITAAGTVDGAFPRYMRITIPGASRQGEPVEGHWFLGRLQAGLTLPINVPLNWSDSDDEEPNVDLQTMYSGVRVAYEAGVPRRTIKGTSQGDVDRWRVAFRSMVRALAGYSRRPVVLCQDDLQQNLRGIYSRFVDSTEFENEGWRYDADAGRWVRVGDLSVTFEQEV